MSPTSYQTAPPRALIITTTPLRVKPLAAAFALMWHARWCNSLRNLLDPVPSECFASLLIPRSLIFNILPTFRIAPTVFVPLHFKNEPFLSF